MGVPRTPLKVTVDGLGEFRFRHRTLRDDLRVQAETERILGGTEGLPPYLVQAAHIIATLTVLLVDSPEGFSLDDLDPFDDGAYQKLVAVHGGLRSAEDRFRGRLSGAGAGPGGDGGAHAADLVPPQIPPPHD